MIAGLLHAASVLALGNNGRLHAQGEGAKDRATADTAYAAVSNTSHILGFAPAYKGKEITLYAYADYISKLLIPVATNQVNDSGSFHFTFNNNQIQHLLIRSGNEQAGMYVEPQKDYTILFPGRDTLRYPNLNVLQEVELSFAVYDTTEINARIIDYNERFASFWTDNYQFFVLKQYKARLDSFATAIKAHYAPCNNAYLNQYIELALAKLELNTFHSKPDLASRYLLHQPIEYDNFEYMGFFNEFFHQYVQNYALSKNGEGFIAAVNTTANHDACMRILGGDKLLENDTLRELVFLKGLSEIYYNPAYKRANVLKLIDHIASNSLIQAHRTIASNVLRTFSALQPGSMAPNFTVSDRKGKAHSLSDYKGKYLYLMFWTSNSTASMQEMKLLPALKRKYGDKITFITISEFQDSLAEKQFMKTPRYDWTFLHTIEGQTLKDSYEIKSYPAYYLINPQGKFVQVPALSPVQSIESSLYEIIRKIRLKEGP